MNAASPKPSGAYQRTLEYLQRKQETQPQEAIERKFTIAISRQYGARGSQIARKIGEQLTWQVYDRNLVDEITSDAELQATLAETVDERHKSWIVECFEAFAASPSLSDAAYVHRLVKVLLSLAADGECVIVGRGAGFRLPMETTLRVGLVAPLKDRTQRIASEQQTSKQEAASQIKKIDHERRMFVKNHFHKDPNELEHYDLVLNTSRFSDEQCASCVVDAYQHARKREPAAS